MGKRRYKVAGPFPAYGTSPGEWFTGDPDDTSIQQNLVSGVIVAEADEKPVKKKCPACTGQGVKRPPTFATRAEFGEHYQTKHPGLIAPEYEEEEE